MRSKNLFYILLCTAFTTTSANSTDKTEKINIYVSNDSPYAVTIQQENFKLAMPAKTRQLNVPLLNYFPTKLYYQNKLVCTWYIDANPDMNKELIGLTFNGQRCISDYVSNP